MLILVSAIKMAGRLTNKTAGAKAKISKEKSNILILYVEFLKISGIL
jgi:hypothetical protein